jgi:hypothetical protein
MSIKITANDGNGHLVSDSIFGYSYSEEVTPLEPSSTYGGTGQLSFSGIAVTDENSEVLHHNSKLIINNNVTLTDTARGAVDVQVKRVSTSNGIASVTGDTVQWRLNVIKTALPHGGENKTLLTAIEYYCSLVGITPIFDDNFDATLDLVPVNFIGWKGNVWDNLKMLCSGVSASATENIGIEMYVSGQDLHFREAKSQTLTEYQIGVIDSSISVDVFDAAKQVEVYNYNTSYGENKVFYEEANYAEDADPATVFKASIIDSMQVDAGATLKKVFKIDATLESINQPVCVSTITRTPPAPYSGTTGEYVIVGTDGLPILPAQWNEMGGSVTIALTEVPGEIEITIVAPPITQLEKDNGNGYAIAPYKIGVESSGDADYPALWLTGTGVFFNKKKQIFLTGASDTITPKDAATTVDNLFISDNFNASSRGVAAAQLACGPTIALSQDASGDLPFGTAIGSVQNFNDNSYRVISASYTESSVSLRSSVCTTIAEFNAAWADDTFAEFTDTALDPVTHPTTALKFNEFTIVPLMDVHTV